MIFQIRCKIESDISKSITPDELNLNENKKYIQPSSRGAEPKSYGFIEYKIPIKIN